MVTNYGGQVGVLKRFSSSRLTGIGTGTDRLIEEPEPEDPVPVPVPTF